MLWPAPFPVACPLSQMLGRTSVLHLVPAAAPHPSHHISPSAFHPHISPYELDRLRYADRVAVGTQSSHSGGNPMSQRECAGFNWPGFSVCAGEPLGVGPIAGEYATACIWRSDN